MLPLGSTSFVRLVMGDHKLSVLSFSLENVDGALLKLVDMVNP